MAEPLTFREAVGTQMRSSFHIERAEIVRADDEMEGADDSRIVELSFASNTPIQHWFGYLELDMAESSVRLDRLKQGGALLWNHDSNEQIGVVADVTLDKNKARASVKFSRSECGEENYRDVLDGIKQNVSVGFIPHTLEQKVDAKGKQIYQDGEPVYISRDWQPFEISLVSIPADISVGVGRSLETLKEQRTMAEENNVSFMMMMARNLLDQGRVTSLDEIFDRVKHTSAQQLQQLANEMFNEDKLSYLIMEPAHGVSTR
jgi:phage head maturation protease